MEEMKGNRRIRDRHRGLQRIVLQSIAAAGMLGIALVAPNALGAMAKLGLLPGKRQRDSINAARDRLLRKGLLIKEGNGLRLTSAGEKQLERLETLDYKPTYEEEWDGKWRVLIFDIPEKRRSAREKVRSVLQRIGFVRLQDSVWLYPHDREDVLTLLKADFHIGKDILYIVADTIEGDFRWRRHFGLR